MKRFPKLLVTLLVLAMVFSIFAAIPVAAASYEAVRIKTAHLTVGHYNGLSMDGEIIKHSANTDYNHEIGCMIDNDNKGAYWSKPYKFSDLKDNGGQIVPVVLIDVAAANNGQGATVSAFEMRLRSALDCYVLHCELQGTLSADSTTWVTLADAKISEDSWGAEPKQRVEFEEKTIYKFRLLVYDIGEADIAADDYKDYQVCKGDETRFTLAEIDLLVKVEDSGNGGTTPKPTTPNQTTTRPGGIQLPGQNTTKPVTTQPAATQPAATQPSTKAPTTPAATQPGTKAPTTPAATQPGTKAPTTPVATQPGTQAPTTATTVVTEPTGTVDPSAPTEPTGTVDPSAPTMDPSAPTDEPTVAPTDEPTVAPTVEATEPEATTPTTDTGAEETPDNTWIIIVAIVAAALIAGGAIFFIIKKKKA